MHYLSQNFDTRHKAGFALLTNGGDDVTLRETIRNVFTRDVKWSPICFMSFLKFMHFYFSIIRNNK